MIDLLKFFALYYIAAAAVYGWGLIAQLVLGL